VATPFAWRTSPTRVEIVQGEAAPAPADTDPGRGRQLFDAKGCVGCHQGPDSGQDHGFPDLTQVADWAAERRDGYSAAEYVGESIRDPGAFISPAAESGQTEMPDLGLSDPEIDALVAYLLGRE
jgi:mono/diheme cytochrome c family protein